VSSAQPMWAATEYSEDEWRRSAAHRPLRDVNVNQIALLYRHWIWANVQRKRFEATMGTAAKPDAGGAFLIDECWTAMYLWYALTWSVLEGFNDRDIDLRGPLADDVNVVSDPLRRCRNAVLHVSAHHQHDERLFEVMRVPNIVERMLRLSIGLGRLFTEESRARKAEGRLGA